MSVCRHKELVSHIKNLFFNMGVFILYLVSNGSYSLSMYQCFFCFHSSSYLAVEFTSSSAVSLHVCEYVWKERNKQMQKLKSKLYPGGGRT